MQSELNNIYYWCKINNLYSNIDKCNTIFLTQPIHEPIVVQYSLNNLTTSKEEVKNDLEIKCGSNLSLNIKTRFNKAFM